MIASEGKSPIGTPIAEVAIDVPLVRRLIDNKIYGFGGLPLAISGKTIGVSDFMYAIYERVGTMLNHAGMYSLLKLAVPSAVLVRHYLPLND